MKGVRFASPSLIIIGRVAALHDEFKWIENSAVDEDYFTPISEVNAKHVVVC
jgi:hypothetical protein